MMMIFRLLFILIITSNFSCNPVREKDEIEQETVWPIEVNLDNYEKSKVLLLKHPDSIGFSNFLGDYLDFQNSLDIYSRYGIDCLADCIRIEFFNNEDTLLVDGFKIPLHDLRKTVFNILANRDSAYYPIDSLKIVDGAGVDRYITKMNFKLLFHTQHRNGVNILYSQISKAMYDYSGSLMKEWSDSSIGEINQSKLNYIDSLVFNKMSVHEIYDTVGWPHALVR